MNKDMFRVELCTLIKSKFIHNKMSVLEDMLSSFNTNDFKYKLARILPNDEQSLGNIFSQLNNFNPEVYTPVKQITNRTKRQI